MPWRLQLARQFEAMCALSSQVAASTPSRVGRLPMNGFKNRYSNVIPCELWQSVADCTGCARLLPSFGGNRS